MLPQEFPLGWVNTRYASCGGSRLLEQCLHPWQSTRLIHHELTGLQAKGTHMSEQFGRTFIDALGKLEKENELDPIVALFADACEVGNVVSPRTFEGKGGAHAFWRTYRETLGDVESEFRNIIATEDRIALEWTTTGANAEGKRIDYDGVSILEVADDKIVRFWAYFDPAKLGQEIRG